jgi:hypothetical protein
MLRNTVLASLAAALSAPAGVSAQLSNCAFTFTNPNNNEVWGWDLAPLYTTPGYYAPYNLSFQGVNYPNNAFNLNLCAPSPSQCIPQSYVPISQNGIVVETWGSTPPCTYNALGAKYCQQSPTKVVMNECCTQDCTVLATSAAAVSFPLNPALLGRGVGDGIVLQFPTVQDPNTGKTICETGTPTMAAQYSITCQPSILFEVFEVQNMGCEFNFVIYSKYGCATLTASTTQGPTTAGPTTPGYISAGSVFLLILFILAVVYFGGGTIVLRATSGAWNIPNRSAWVSLGAMIKDGGDFIKNGFQKRPAGFADPATADAGGKPSGGDYHEPDGGAFGVKATTSGAAVDEPYDDL